MRKLKKCDERAFNFKDCVFVIENRMIFHEIQHIIEQRRFILIGKFIFIMLQSQLDITLITHCLNLGVAYIDILQDW